MLFEGIGWSEVSFEASMPLREFPLRPFLDKLYSKLTANQTS
jgi:hypothetical protein